MKHELLNKLLQLAKWPSRKPKHILPPKWQKRGISLCGRLVGKSMAFSTAQPQRCKKPQKQNGCKRSPQFTSPHCSWGGFSAPPQVRWEVGRTQHVPQKSNTQADQTTTGQSRHSVAAGTKPVRSPRFAQRKGPGLPPKRKVMPQSRITVLGQEGGLYRSFRPLTALLTPAAPLTTGRNWDGLAKRQYPP